MRLRSVAVPDHNGRQWCAGAYARAVGAVCICVRRLGGIYIYDVECL